MLYRVSDLELVQNTVLDVSPAILIPHYDHDSSTLFLTSKVCKKFKIYSPKKLVKHYTMKNFSHCTFNLLLRKNNFTKIFVECLPND